MTKMYDYVSGWGEVRVVTETVDENGVRHIRDVVDPTRIGVPIKDGRTIKGWKKQRRS